MYLFQNLHGKKSLPSKTQDNSIPDYLIIKMIPHYISQQTLQSRNRHFFQNFTLVQSKGVLKSMDGEKQQIK